MNQLIPQRYASLIGLGLIYLWGATLLVWVDWIQSEVFFEKIVGFVGADFASLSGLSAFLYVSGLESELKELRSRNSYNEEQANEWKVQAQLAISFLENERAANGASTQQLNEPLQRDGRASGASLSFDAR